MTAYPRIITGLERRSAAKELIERTQREAQQSTWFAGSKPAYTGQRVNMGILKPRFLLDK